MAALLHWVFSAIIFVIFIISHRFYHVRTHGHKKCQGNFCHPSLAEQWPVQGREWGPGWQPGAILLKEPRDVRVCRNRKKSLLEKEGKLMHLHGHHLNIIRIRVLRIAGGGSSIVIGPHNPAPAAGPCTTAACHRSNDTNYGVQGPAQPSPASPAQPSPALTLCSWSWAFLQL